MMVLARDPMRRLASPWVHRAADFIAQTRRAREIMTAFEAYAKSIGCEIGTGAMCDSLVVDDEQARKLAAWWREHNE